MNTRRAYGKLGSGFSLIELLVSMVIALVVTLAISSVLIRSEGSKRSTTSVNDLNQTGSYIAYVMDRVVRSAGSGFAQNWSDAFGCIIDASKANAAILPMPVAAPSPFANVPLQVRLAPVIIRKGLADSGGQVRGDVLTVMAGTAGGGDLPQKVRPPVGAPPADLMGVTNALGFRDRDLVLVAEQGMTLNAAGGCMVQQVVAAPTAADPPTAVTSTASPLTLNFNGGTYSKSNGNRVALNSFVTNSGTIAIQLGSAPDNPPQMLMYAVGDNNTLFSYDLLQMNGNQSTPVADNVVEMRALYGVDTDSNGTFDTWIAPDTVGYSAAALTAGTVAAQTNLRRIVAVRVAMILRTSLQERISDRYYGKLPDSTPPASLPTTVLTMFGDLPPAVQLTRSIVGADNLYRYRTIEFTVPLRNTLYAP